MWISTDLAFKLATYFRLLYLSIDRAERDVWVELREYLSLHSISFPSNFLEFIDAETDFAPSNKLVRFLLIIAVRVGIKMPVVWVQGEEMEKIMSCLSVAEKLLHETDNEVSINNNEIRIALAELEGKISAQLPGRLQRMINKVNHLNSSDHLQLIEFTELTRPESSA